MEVAMEGVEEHFLHADEIFAGAELAGGGGAAMELGVGDHEVHVNENIEVIKSWVFELWEAVSSGGHGAASTVKNRIHSSWNSILEASLQDPKHYLGLVIQILCLLMIVAIAFGVYVIVDRLNTARLFANERAAMKVAQTERPAIPSSPPRAAEDTPLTHSQIEWCRALYSSWGGNIEEREVELATLVLGCRGMTVAKAIKNLRLLAVAQEIESSNHVAVQAQRGVPVRQASISPVPAPRRGRAASPAIPSTEQGRVASPRRASTRSYAAAEVGHVHDQAPVPPGRLTGVPALIPPAAEPTHPVPSNPSTVSRSRSRSPAIASGTGTGGASSSKNPRKREAAGEPADTPAKLQRMTPATPSSGLKREREDPLAAARQAVKDQVAKQQSSTLKRLQQSSTKKTRKS